MNTWIFQGNPRIFNVNQYLADRKRIWWSLRQKHFLNMLSIGDEVYLWRSDGDMKGSGGIIARALVIGPTVDRIDDDAKEYWFISGWLNLGWAYR